MCSRKYTLDGFEKLAGRRAARKYGISGCLPASYLEKQFWEEMSGGGGKKEMVEYGINIDGSAFSSSVNDPLGASNWNLNVATNSTSLICLLDSDFIYTFILFCIYVFLFLNLMELVYAFCHSLFRSLDSCLDQCSVC